MFFRFGQGSIRASGNRSRRPPWHWRRKDRQAAMALQSSAKAGTRGLVEWTYGCYVWVLFVLLVLPVAMLVALLNRPAQGRFLVHFCARLLFFLSGMRILVEGDDQLPHRPHVLLANHTSFLDAILLTALLPPRPGYAFTARRQFASQRLLWPFLHGLGTIIFKQHADRHHVHNIEMMEAALRRGDNLVVFPEGRFTAEPGVLPFHSGAFVAAAQAGAPMVVAGLRGTRTALRLGTWLPRRTTVSLHIGRVFMAESADAFTLQKLEQRAREAIMQLSAEPDASVK